ncbi:lymphocyte antigen 6D-like [Epinephelus fuscoguttatus]|uniref:lymphocyte antigen 6D-like n=1 Tax=Epinephelus fuscoguttatus TaxID=293821 RepID=UPI0020D1A927|nr:lymphocyte antigen 6D-like [Epinephelus fuscoguttatus]
MMQWFGALILFVTLSAAFGLRCHSCSGKSCTGPIDCPPNFDRCATAEVNGQVVKSCMTKSNCVNPIKCCEGDLCNGSPAGPTPKPPGPTSKPTGSSNIPTGSSVLLLLASSGIITLFL